MSAGSVMPSERVRVWRVVPEVVHPDAEVDTSELEPETGLTQRAARELANERNHAGVPRPTIEWVAEPTERIVDRGSLLTAFRE